MGEAHNYRDLKSATMASLTHKRHRPDSDDDEIDASIIFKTQEHFARYLIIESANKDKLITSPSPFVIEKKNRSPYWYGKVGEKVKYQTLLVETTRKSQTENLLRQLGKVNPKSIKHDLLQTQVLVLQLNFLNY